MLKFSVQCLAFLYVDVVEVFEVYRLLPLCRMRSTVYNGRVGLGAVHDMP